MKETAAPRISLGASPNGTSRILHTVLAEKLTEAPWKGSSLAALQNRTIRLAVTDRNEAADVVVTGDTVEIKPGGDTKPPVVVSLDMRTLPVILGIPLWDSPWGGKGGPARIPAVWQKGGRQLLAALTKRKVRVGGLVTHPLQVLRVLQILGVPPGIVG